jgi:hypothetical protein
MQSTKRIAGVGGEVFQLVAATGILGSFAYGIVQYNKRPSAIEQTKISGSIEQHDTSTDVRINIDSPLIPSSGSVKLAVDISSLKTGVADLVGGAAAAHLARVAWSGSGTRAARGLCGVLAVAIPCVVLSSSMSLEKK